MDQDKGLYHCFGCGESGDVVALVEKIKDRIPRGPRVLEGQGRRGAVVERRTERLRVGCMSTAAKPEPGMEWILDEVAARYTAALAGHAEARTSSAPAGWTSRSSSTTGSDSAIASRYRGT